MKAYVFLLVLASVIFAAGCPAAANDCFECGGVGGIPCAATDSCTGAYIEGLGNVACECPQGEPCVCHCPYNEYGALKEQLNPEGPRECPPRCTGGCSKDMTICIMGTTEGMDSGGNAEIDYIRGEVLVKTSEGMWLRATQGARLDKGAEVRTGPGGGVKMTIDDGSEIIMSENTDLRIAELFPVRTKSTLSIVIELTKGILFSDVTTRDGTRFDVDTAVSVTGVQGTKFEVSFDGVNSETKVYEGDVTVTSKYGDSMSLGPSEKVSVSESGFGEKEVFDQSVQDKWWEEAGGTGAGCCAGFAFLASALGIFLMEKE